MGQRSSSSSSSRQVRSRGIGTLIGNGWLREPARPLARGWGDARGRSAMKKCMFLQVPTDVRHMLGPQAPPLAPPPPRPDAPIVTSPRRPERFVRELPAFPAAARARLAPAGALAPPAASPPAVAQWWEDPIALGSLLILAPPLGLAALWSSGRYSSDARWALTIMTALTMCMMTAVLLAVLVLHS